MTDSEGFEPGPRFTKVRTIAFSCIMIVSFVWTVLLFVELYIRWNVSDSLQRGMVVVLSVINAGTVVMLIVLLILPFRVWLDTARMILLLVAHGGTAIGFTVWSPGFSCPNASIDGEGTCRLLNMYILLGSWVVPALVLAYAACLATAYVMYCKHFNKQDSIVSSSIDEEKAPTTRGSVLPFMHPPSSSTPMTTHFLGPIHSSLPPPGPIYPSLPPTRFIYPSVPPPTDRRISTNTRMSIGDASKRTSRPSRHFSTVPSVAAPSPSPSLTVERQRKDSMVSVSEYSQNSRSSGRMTLTKPIPLSKFEAY